MKQVLKNMSGYLFKYLFNYMFAYAEDVNLYTMHI